MARPKKKKKQILDFISNEPHLTAMESCNNWFDFHALPFTNLLNGDNIHSAYLKKGQMKTEHTDFINCISHVSEWEEASMTMLTFHSSETIFF